MALRYGNLILLEGSEPAGHTISTFRMGIAALRPLTFLMKDKPDAFTVEKASGGGSGEVVRFGDSISLLSSTSQPGNRFYLATPDFVDTKINHKESMEDRRKRQKGSPRGIDVGTGKGDWDKQWIILNASDIASKEPVNFGDTIALKLQRAVMETDYYLSLAEEAKVFTFPGTYKRVIANKEFGAKEKWKAVKISPPFDELDLGVILDPVPGAVPSLPSGFTAQQIVIGAISAVPKIGSVVGAVVKLFWKEDTVDVWDQVKTRVHEAITHEMSEARMSYLNTWLAAARKNFKQYIKLKNPEEKGNYLTVVLADLNRFKLEVGNPKNPENALYCLVGTAVLHITALRERYLFGEELYGKSDEDNKTAHEDLLENIAYYQDLAKRVRENIITKRKSYISYKEDEFGMVRGWVFQDTYTGEKEICANATQAETKYNEHINFHISRLTEKIDDMLASIKVFPYMDPKNENMPIKVGRYWQ